jgi:hypothetical protein
MEILAGNGIQNAFKELGIKAKCAYKSSHEPYYEIWDVDKRDVKILEETTEWLDEWGWWRGAKGSNLGTAADFFTVNGQFMIGWNGPSRDDLREQWRNEPDEERASYNYSFTKYEEQMKPRTYETLLEYMREEIGASMESNIIALAVDLARANGKTVSGLFKVYEG